MLTIKTRVGESENWLRRAWDQWINKCKYPLSKIGWLSELNEEVKELYDETHAAYHVEFPQMTENGLWPKDEQTFKEFILSCHYASKDELEKLGLKADDRVMLTHLGDVVSKNGWHYAYLVLSTKRIYIYTSNGWIDITRDYETKKNKIFNNRLTIYRNDNPDLMRKWEVENWVMRKAQSFFYAIYRFFHSLDSVYLCLRFPFLYPRNRWTGLHYNNWKLLDKLKEIGKDTFEYGDADEHFKVTVKNRWKWVQYKALKWFHDVFLQIVFCWTSHSEIDNLDEGWMRRFGIDLLRELKAQLKKDKYLYQYRITDIKEKYGEMCWYDCGCTKEAHAIIGKYEALSEHTCIHCGRPARYITSGWICPYCADCIDPRAIKGSDVLDDDGKFVGYINDDGAFVDKETYEREQAESCGE